MSLTPFLEKLTPKIVKTFSRINYFQVNDELKTLPEDLESDKEIEDHVILVGMGRNGKHIMEACKQFKITIRIVDRNPTIVENQQALRLPIIYGKASNESILKELNITSANAL